MLFPNITMRLFYKRESKDYNDVFLNAEIDVVFQVGRSVEPVIKVSSELRADLKCPHSKLEV